MDPMSATDARPDTESTDPLVEVLDEQQDRDLQDAPDTEILAALEEMVGHPQYPCLGARSVFRREAAEIVVLGDMCDPDSLEQLSDALDTWAGVLEAAASEALASLDAATMACWAPRATFCMWARPAT